MGLETIRNGEIFFINNDREETRLFYFVASVQLRNLKLISIEAKLNDHLCNGFTTLHFHMFLIVKVLYLS